MKLKHIAQEVLSEISLQRGDADSASSLQLLQLVMEGWEELLKAQLQGMTPMDGQTLDPKVIALIKKTAIDKQGELYICKHYRYGRDRHILFKIDEPYATACVGMIDTQTNKNPYSVAMTFGVDAPQVHWSIVADEYKGMKYGAFLYDTLLYKYGALQSDSILYEGSLNMWVHHMSSTGRITAAVIKTDAGWFSKGQRVVVPTTVKDLKDTKYLERIDSIAVFYDVPPQLQVIDRFTDGLTPRDGSLGIIYSDSNLDEPGQFQTYDVTAGFDQENEDATLTLADFLDQYSYDDLIAMADQGEVEFGKTARIFMQDSDTLKADDGASITKAQKVILACNDAIVLVEPMGDEINYKII
jgi:hypothetical protein